MPHEIPIAKDTAAQKGVSFRRRVYEILENGTIGDRTATIVGRSIMGLIVLNLVAVTLDSVPDLAARYSLLFGVIEIVSLVAFTIEYGLRLWVAVEHPLGQQYPPWKARLKFATTPQGIVDLVSVLPFWLGPFLPDEARILLVFRVIRFLKLGRYSPGMRSLLEVLYAERRALFGCGVILIGATLIAATAMYLAERHVQPALLGTIPDAMWWAIVTLGTIGYGDIVPVTTLGRLIATMTIFVGLIMVSLPVGIIATAFANDIHRRHFVVTWSMVARVPLFAELSAYEVADIMGLLRAQQVEAGTVIARQGESAHSMYFIAAGDVDIKTPHRQLRLTVGHFFGEVAILRKARRSATVTAVTRTSLLVLEAQDVHALMERQPGIARRIRETAHRRLGEGGLGRGDMLQDEFAHTAPLAASEADRPD